MSKKNADRGRRAKQILTGMDAVYQNGTDEHDLVDFLTDCVHLYGIVWLDDRVQSAIRNATTEKAMEAKHG